MTIRNNESGFFRELIENLDEYIYCVQYENGAVVSTYHTSSCLRVTGYSVEEFTADGKLWFSMILEKDRDKVQGFLDDVVRLKRPGILEHRIIHKSGTERWVNNKVAVTLDAKGEIKSLNGFIMDITDMKAAIKKLAQLNRAVEQSPSTVVITNAVGEIEYANPKFSSLTGYTIEEAAGKNPSILKSGEQPKEFYRHLWDTILSGKEWRGEFHNRKKNGELYWEFASISPIRDSEGKITHFVAVKEDVTERKSAQEALRVSEEKLRQRMDLMERDLKLAQMTQKALLPQNAPVLELLEVDYRYLPLDQVGGDYFSFMSGPDRSLGVFVGDVVGHGVSAALYVSLIKSVSERIFLDHGNNPARYIENLNKLLINEMKSSFITAVYGLFDFRNDSVRLTLANGGHPHPVVYRAETGEFTQVKTSGTVIGMIETAMFQEEQILLFPGDRVFIFTDGIPETENESRQIIGFEEDLMDLFVRAHRTGLGGTLDAILEEVRAFAGNNPH